MAVDTIRAAREALPRLPHVAAFDTAFHATLRSHAYIYPAPVRLARGVGRPALRLPRAVGGVVGPARRASCSSAIRAELGLLVAHLGSGCSVTAVEGGRSVWTSMGMTPLEGLMMGTRAGSFDPGVALETARRADGVSVDQLSDALEHESGLLGVSGVSGDVREVEAAAAAGNERAALAIQMFCRRTAGYIAAACDIAAAASTPSSSPAASASTRPASARRSSAAWACWASGAIGDQSVEEDAVLSAPGSAVAILRVEAREDLVIADAVGEEIRRGWRGSPTSG